MLKKIRVLFLGLVVLAGSACVTPTHASSAPTVIMTRIMSAGLLGSKDEMIILHNNTGVEVDLTGWCLMNKSAVAFACFNSSRTDVTERFYLPPYENVVIVSQEYVTGSGTPSGNHVLIYPVTNQSTGSIVNSADTLSLVNSRGEVVDTKTWSTLIPSGKVLSRLRILTGPDIYATSNDTADWSFELRTDPPLSILDVRISPLTTDLDPTPDPDPETNPDDPSSENSSNPSATPPVLAPIITEILANPAGTDTGKEYVELYNPNESAPLLLDQFTIRIGIDSPKTYQFPPGVSIPPLGYALFTNTDLGFTLVNTTGRLQLYKGEVGVGVPIEYTDAKDDYAWALINGAWQYTRNLTPGGENSIGELFATAEEALDDDVAKPCAANQFRNPETGRCKLLSSTSAAPAVCKEGQERNLETNRCRSIVTATKTQTPCKEGQERNPETNRCRNITKMSSAGFGVKGVKDTSGETSWYYWAAIVAIVLLIMSYAVWEWRQELLRLWKRITKATFAKRPH